VACTELDLAIPGGGFGDHPISRLLAPPLTSTVWDVERVAQVATGFLVDGLEDERPDHPSRELVAPVLLPRTPTGPAPV
jgi:DNA-binding LacI/PurR family transcriptional regulator